jgi:hypothetical protein
MWFVDKLGKGPAASPTQATAPNGKAPEPAQSAPRAAAPQAAPQPAPAPTPEQPKKKKGWF